MKVENKYVIDDKPVDLFEKFGPITVYQRGDDEDRVLYFVQNHCVLKELHISADCGQNVGYISNLEFLDPRDKR